MSTESPAWLAVASAEHVRRAVELGIVQVNHGKRAPLARMHAGETIVFYSPVEQMGDRRPLQEFTALGTLTGEEIWQAEEEGLTPCRRGAAYITGHPVPLETVRDRLRLTEQPGWGYQLRRGLLPLDPRDAEVIRAQMGA